MRLRTIKPGFFKNEELAECPALTRLLFAGLWTLADRDGRLEDRPKRIKAELLAYDDGDAEGMLDDLARRGFILRYAVGEARYIQVVNFSKHQNPHVKEPASAIPAPGAPAPPPPPPAPMQAEHGASTVQAPGEHRSSRADIGELSSVNSDGVPPSASAEAPRTTGKPLPKPSARETVVDEAFEDELASEFEAAFGTREAARDCIAAAMGHKARSKYTDQRAYLRNWVRSDAEKAQQRRGPPVASAPTPLHKPRGIGPAVPADSPFLRYVK